MKWVKYIIFRYRIQGLINNKRMYDDVCQYSTKMEKKP